ncbi:flagellar motor switch protein FliM, partial [bacterium LRH843]|nr:flagellar motor switch protein FliM [bacterium LRH843]
VDVLFGGRRSNKPIRIEGRPYTSIEQNVVRQINDIILVDMGASFDPLSPATFQFDRLETNPRFATIAHPSDTVILLQLRIDM